MQVLSLEYFSMVLCNRVKACEAVQSGGKAEVKKGNCVRARAHTRTHAPSCNSADF